MLLCCSAVRAETVALALSGGGARGFAFIGIVQALEEAGLEPDLVVGTSMGSVLGGLYASGYTAADLRDIALKTDWSNIFLDRPARRSLFLGRKETSSMHILSLRFRGFVPELPVAFTHGQQLTELLFDLVHRAPYQPWPSFDDLRIPFRAVATDLISGRAVIFDRGDLAEAMRASISLPLVITPYRLDSLVLADGGVVENIPVDIARSQGADVVIAVDLSADLADPEDLSVPWELANRVTTIMHLERNARSRSAADLVIVPEVGMHRASDFTNVDSLIQAGYRAARAHLKELRALYARSDSTTPRARDESFASRANLRRLYAQAAVGLPPLRYEFAGVRQIPDSVVARLPVGPNGLAKLELLRRSYMDRGQVLAHATVLELKEDGTLSSRWEEGRIRSIRVAGLRRYRPGILLQEFTQRPGEVFNLRRARRGISQIYGSDLFESVTLAVLPTDSGAHLTLRAQERQSPQLRFGAGFSVERKGRGFAEFLNDNLLNSGARLALFGKYGEMDEELRAAVTFDRFPLGTPVDRALQSYITTDLRAGWRREEYNFFDDDHKPVGFYFFERTGGELWVGRAFRRFSEVAGGLRHERVRTGGIDEPTADITTVSARGVVDTKDRYPFPTSGVAFNGVYEYALRSQSDGRAFNRLRGSGDIYVPLHRRVVLHGRGDYGWNDRILPLWGQFPLGGEENLLGMHTAEQLGNSKLAALGEVRWDLLSRWLADAFVSAIYTAGAVSAESTPFPEDGDYRHGFGGSFGLSTFLGPMTLTVGHLLESSHNRELTHIYLNLGHRF